MKANAAALLPIFERKMRLEVPLFQRRYVWNQEHHWQPLWEDVARKFTEYLEGRKDAPVHFLGAMVLDQKQTPTTHVERRQVIDGQQRLTTLQLFIAAFRDFCRENDCPDLAGECEKYTLNTGMMADAAVEKYKVWPTLLDRPQFVDVLGPVRGPRSRPSTPRYGRRAPASRSRGRAWSRRTCSSTTSSPTSSSAPRTTRRRRPTSRSPPGWRSASRRSRTPSRWSSSTWRAGGDDAQVIFETLNARGEPLLPADLVRNYIFLRAVRRGESPEELHEQFWRRFDDPFWAEKVPQGRLLRPRSDLFLQHFLASRVATDIPIGHLFVEYKFWTERERPFPTVRDELAAVARQGEVFRRLSAPATGDVLYPLATFLQRFDIGTAYPVLLHLAEVGLTDGQWREVAAVLESHLLRRAVCGRTTKGYNRVFLTLTKALHRGEATPAAVRKYLAELTGASVEWPDDQAFRAAWRTLDAYHALTNAKLVHVLRRLSDTYLGPKTETVVVSDLTVEHLLPQSWTDHWPLPEGSAGLSGEALQAAPPDDPRAEASGRRNELLQTFGNLTIITQPLNSAVSNGPWQDKRPAVLTASLLPINQQLHGYAAWDEAAIAARSDALFERAVKVWPGPGAS